jgi:hypothetical protein
MLSWLFFVMGSKDVKVPVLIGDRHKTEGGNRATGNATGNRSEIKWSEPIRKGFWRGQRSMRWSETSTARLHLLAPNITAIWRTISKNTSGDTEAVDRAELGYSYWQVTIMVSRYVGNTWQLHHHPSGAFTHKFYFSTIPAEPDLSFTFSVCSIWVFTHNSAGSRVEKLLMGLRYHPDAIIIWELVVSL